LESQHARRPSLAGEPVGGLPSLRRALGLCAYGSSILSLATWCLAFELAQQRGYRIIPPTKDDLPSP
jgi:hypothetical protein